ncbi:hypothetical protein POF50_021055 [Streptomyces sp. SL13]|uniref:Uncharacterized protein n=1 Tax=Streptantibioticus silvisoli TaxID=2705255 RepID=A0AA90H5W6_9ACTN|nr:hypothetical protein [Streptantibioticus silvisoli]MDI5965090.1 hypothetical protein [Streptantibioticus silvisoli]MDI5971791.1 hypothetical protein [Streptantibioticus silvisoli]
MRLAQRIALIAIGLAATAVVLALPAARAATHVVRTAVTADGTAPQPDNWGKP